MYKKGIFHELNESVDGTKRYVPHFTDKWNSYLLFAQCKWNMLLKMKIWLFGPASWLAVNSVELI